MVRAAHIREPASARRLDAFRLGLGDLRLGQAEHTADAGPGVARYQHRAAFIGCVERQQLDLGPVLVGFEAMAGIGDVPAEMPDRALGSIAGGSSTLVNNTKTSFGDSSAGKPPQLPFAVVGNWRM